MAKILPDCPSVKPFRPIRCPVSCSAVSSRLTTDYHVSFAKNIFGCLQQALIRTSPIVFRAGGETSAAQPIDEPVVKVENEPQILPFQTR